MHYFITGATGFIGRHLVRSLVNRGDQVTVLLRTPAKRKLLPDSVEVIAGDLSSFTTRDIEIPNADIVVHLAGTIAAEDPDEYRQTNYRYLVDFVRYLEGRPHHPKRFVFASSLAAAGPTTKGNPKDETDPLLPIDPYGIAKADAEKFLQQTTIPVTAFRPPIVLGPEDSASFTLFKMARKGFGFQVGADPQELSFVDVRDLVEAIILMSEEDGSAFESYFTGHPDIIDVHELWTTLGDCFGSRMRILEVPSSGLKALMKLGVWSSKVLPFNNQLDEKQFLQLTAEAFTCDSSRLTRRCGWAPKHGLEACLTHALEGYREAGWLQG